MKSPRVLRISPLVFAFCLLSLSSNLAYGQNLTAKFNKLRSRHKIASKDVSISIQKKIAPHQWQPFFEVNSSKAFIPASLTKILTAISSFETYPNNYKFLTEFKALNRVKGGVLKGDLYLVGDGDPTLVTERLWLLVHELKRLNIKKVTGNLIYDDSVFDDVKFSPSRSTKNHRAYSAPVSGLSYNWNSLFVRVFPRSKGQKNRIYIDPPDPSVRIKNKSITGNKTRLAVSRVSTDTYDSIFVSGVLRPGEEYKVYRSHTMPSRRAANQAMSLLSQAGVQVVGSIKEGKAPKSALQLAEVKSVGVDEIIKMMMKYSNNFIAEMLTKKMDAMENNRRGSLKGGLKLIESVIGEMSQQKFVIKNPSGLTRANKVTTLLLTDLLKKTAENPAYGAEFLSSLPRAGIDGTLKKRMTKIKGRLRAKTGLLDGVVGLAGYMTSVKGERYAFGMIYNGPVSKQGRAKDLFDSLSELVVLTY